MPELWEVMTVLTCRLRDVRFAIQEHAIKQRLLTPTTRSSAPEQTTHPGWGGRRTPGRPTRPLLTEAQAARVRYITQQCGSRMDLALAIEMNVHLSTIRRWRRQFAKELRA